MSSSKPVTIKGWLALLAVYIIWSTTLGAIHEGVETVNPFWFVCVRFLLAGTLILSICLARGEKLPERRALSINAKIGGLTFFGGHAVSYWVLTQLTTGLVAIISATNAFWMLMLTAWMPPREPLDRAGLMGVVVGFAGMVILLWPQLSHPMDTSGTFWLSVVILLIMGLSWCLGSTLSRKQQTGCSMLMDVALQNLAAGVLMIPVCWLLVDPASVHPTALTWGTMAYLIIFGTLIAYSCYLYAVQNLPMSLVSTTAFVTTMLTIVFGKFALGEVVTWPMIWGTLTILLGVGWVQWLTIRRSTLNAKSH